MPVLAKMFRLLRGQFFFGWNVAQTVKESTIKTLIADINECNASVPVCVANATCHNTEGSYVCSCEVGFTGKYCTGESEISLTQIPRLEMRIAHSDSKVN